ncbi:MAG: hypothetical protein EBR01_10595 [Proteobacteria bacterium]|nr:hypothetical protein [Pseudomonadota bacterium]
MKFNPRILLILILGLSVERALALDLLSVSTENLLNIQAKNRFEELLQLVARFDDAWGKNEPHLAESFLDHSVIPCDSWLSESSGTNLSLQQSREGYLCLILESERINRLSPWKTTGASERIGKTVDTLQNAQLPIKEKLYAEGRIYSSLPKLYGGDFKKALLSLETLKRLEKNSKVTEPWIRRIRRLQGKISEQQEYEPGFYFQNRKETDGLPVGLVPVLFGNFPQGIGVQVRGQDYGLFDTARRIQGRAFVTHRGSVGGEFKYEDFETIPEVKTLFQLSYLHGIQEYHGIGLSSSKSSFDLFIDRGVADVAFQKLLFADVYFKLGWRVHSSHLREARGTLEPGLLGVSNAFDSGLLLEIGFDSRDSEVEPFRGQRIYLQSYLPRESFGSSRSFERFLGLLESYWLLNLQTQLKLQGVFSTVSESTPFSWYSQLSGTVPFPGVRPTRFVDRSMIAMIVELRWKKLSPVTLFGYGSAARMAPSTVELMNQSVRSGGGLGGEIHLTRFRTRAFRIEVGNFGGEWNFNSMIGVALD